MIKTDGDTLTDLKLAYDVYEGEFICQLKNAHAVVLEPGQVRAFFIGSEGKELYYERHPVEGKTHFLRTYPMGNGFDIYALQGKTVRQANNTSYGTMQYHEYVDKPDILYMRTGRGAPVLRVERNKKKFLASFGRYAEEIEWFMKIEALKPNRLEDLKKMQGPAARLSAERP